MGLFAHYVDGIGQRSKDLLGRVCQRQVEVSLQVARKQFFFGDPEVELEDFGNWFEAVSRKLHLANTPFCIEVAPVLREECHSALVLFPHIIRFCFPLNFIPKGKMLGYSCDFDTEHVQISGGGVDAAGELWLACWAMLS